MPKQPSAAKEAVYLQRPPPYSRSSGSNSDPLSPPSSSSPRSPTFPPSSPFPIGAAPPQPTSPTRRRAHSGGTFTQPVALGAVMAGVQQQQPEEEGPMAPPPLPSPWSFPPVGEGYHSLQEYRRGSTGGISGQGGSGQQAAAPRLPPPTPSTSRSHYTSSSSATPPSSAAPRRCAGPKTDELPPPQHPPSDPYELGIVVATDLGYEPFVWVSNVSSRQHAGPLQVAQATAMWRMGERALVQQRTVVIGQLQPATPLPQPQMAPRVVAAAFDVPWLDYVATIGRIPLPVAPFDLSRATSAWRWLSLLSAEASSTTSSAEPDLSFAPLLEDDRAPVDERWTSDTTRGAIAEEAAGGRTKSECRSSSTSSTKKDGKRRSKHPSGSLPSTSPSASDALLQTAADDDSDDSVIVFDPAASNLSDSASSSSEEEPLAEQVRQQRRRRSSGSGIEQRLAGLDVAPRSPTQHTAARSQAERAGVVLQPSPFGPYVPRHQIQPTPVPSTSPLLPPQSDYIAPPPATLQRRPPPPPIDPHNRPHPLYQRHRPRLSDVAERAEKRNAFEDHEEEPSLRPSQVSQTALQLDQADPSPAPEHQHHQEQLAQPQSEREALPRPRSGDLDELSFNFADYNLPPATASYAFPLLRTDFEAMYPPLGTQTSFSAPPAFPATDQPAPVPHMHPQHVDQQQPVVEAEEADSPKPFDPSSCAIDFDQYTLPSPQPGTTSAAPLSAEMEVLYDTLFAPTPQPEPFEPHQVTEGDPSI
ncbi:hypothetical protein JCM6882_009588 [Rhodosporidiobolus microsporus]